MARTPTGLDDRHGRLVEPEVALHGVLDGLGMAGELGRVADHQAELLLVRAEPFEGLEGVGGLEPGGRGVVGDGVFPGQLDGSFGGVDPQGRGRPAVDLGVEREPAGVAEQVEDPPAPGIVGDGPAVVALVEEEAGLLAGQEVDPVGDPVLGDRDRPLGGYPVDDALLDLQPLLRGDPLFATHQDALGAGEGHEPFHQKVATLEQGQAGELDDQPAVEAVDGEPGEAVGLAEDQAGGGPRALDPEEPRSERQGLGQPGFEERVVDRGVVPAIEPDPDRAPGVEQAPGDELPLGADHDDLIAGSGLALDALDRGHEDPGMPGEERAGPSRLDHDAGEAGHRYRSFDRMGSGASRLTGLKWQQWMLLHRCHFSRWPEPAKVRGQANSSIRL